MRNYSCYYGKYVNKKVIKSNSSACWASIDRDGFEYVQNLYIYKFEEPDITYEQIKLLVSIVNQITPCSIVTHKKIKYIKYRKIKGYIKNLIILNFIRALWHETGGILSSQLFLNSLKNPKVIYEDPLEKLLYSYKESFINVNSPYNVFDHNNFHINLSIINLKKFKKMPITVQRDMTNIPIEEN